ncbi:hypothetical protein LEL_08941 [Akanthomyces lecanii RCEF 1005]|uniref:Uncharacterized protein n=1 Tax=Akanthomyces lecanii RCEF 1005 TaxID=1081108 RepID=A0A168CRN7_CORDF|nr:hypothetical protein LEL_08941 [Akanthomyces lecanii RCEF 1005]
MSRFVDPRAPTNASIARLNEIKTDPTLAKLMELRDTLSSEVRQESGTIKDAESAGTKLYQMYRTVESKVRSTRAYLRKLAKTATREEFFNTISTSEINAQLRNDAHSFLDLEADDWKPQCDYSLPERQLLAELICADTTALDGTTRLRHRLYTTHAMLSLGIRKEARALKSAPKLNASSTAQKCAKDQCFMCFWDENIAPNQRFRKFCSPYRSRDHLLSQHLKNIGERFVQCPAPQCAEKKAIFHTLPAFQHHLAEHHDYDNFKRYKGQLKCY